MKTREVFRILSGSLEPALLPLGFSRLKDATGQTLAWTRTCAGRKHETVWCQMDKNAWDPWIGSKFVVEFQQARHKEPGAINGSKRARLADLLTEGERRAVQARQNRVIKKFRVPSATDYSRFMGFPVGNPDLFLEEYRQACRPVKYKDGRHDDIWLLVCNAADVTAWSEFLAGWLAGALERFAKLKGEEYQW